MPAIILFFQNHLENCKQVPIDQVCQYKLWKDRYSKIPGGGHSLGISGWGCAARTLEPLA